MAKGLELLEKQADILFNNTAGWETKALKRIGRRIKNMKSLSYADLQAINNATIVNQDVNAIMEELAMLTRQNVKDVNSIYSDMIAQQHLENQKLYDYRGKPFIPFEENKKLQSIVRAYARTTGESFVGLTMSKAKNIGFVDSNNNFTPIHKKFKSVLDKATMSIVTGTGDLNSEMREVLKELGGSGLRVDYGGGKTRRLDTMVRQNLLWGAKQASVEYNNMIGEELDCDGIEIDWHTFPRPSHDFMQGKQYVLGKARTINGVKFESADEALERLQDYGCLHFKTPIICGISEPAHSPQELARLNEQNHRMIEIDGVSKTGYEWKQTMRKLETEARKTKDQIEILKSSGDLTGSRQLNEKLNAIKDKYNLVAEGSGIKAQPEKMAVIKSNKTVDNFSKNGIIKEEKENSPRKAKKQDYSVNWAKIQSAEYEDKFKKLSENEKVRNSILIRSKWALNNRDGRNTEELYAISLKTGTEIGNITNQHYVKAVKRTPEFTRKLKHADDNGDNVLLIHNHPDGMPPSISDINNLFDNKNVSGITVGHDGSIYYYSKPAEKIDEDDWIIVLKHYNKYSQFTAEEKALEALKGKYGFEFIKL